MVIHLHVVFRGVLSFPFSSSFHTLILHPPLRFSILFLYASNTTLTPTTTHNDDHRHQTHQSITTLDHLHCPTNDAKKKLIRQTLISRHFLVNASVHNWEHSYSSEKGWLTYQSCFMKRFVNTFFQFYKILVLTFTSSQISISISKVIQYKMCRCKHPWLPYPLESFLDQNLEHHLPAYEDRRNLFFMFLGASLSPPPIASQANVQYGLCSLIQLTFKA